MAKITIKSNPNYNGVDFGIPFANGVAETEDTWLITMFKEKGYNVEEATTEEEPEEVEPEPEEKSEPKAPAKKTTTKKEG